MLRISVVGRHEISFLQCTEYLNGWIAEEVVEEDGAGENSHDSLTFLLK